MNASDIETATREQWSVLELFGHRRLAGMVDEVQFAGAQFVRIRVPGLKRDPEGKVTGLDLDKLLMEQRYAPAAVFSLTATTEQAVMRVLDQELRYCSVPLLPPPGTPPETEEPQDVAGSPIDPTDDMHDEEEPDA